MNQSKKEDTGIFFVVASFSLRKSQLKQDGAGYTAVFVLPVVSSFQIFTRSGGFPLLGMWSS
jgi:hypothetical protein